MRRLGKGAGRDGIRRIGPAPRPDPPFPVASRPLGRRPGVHGCPGGPGPPGDPVLRNIFPPPEKCPKTARVHHPWLPIRPWGFSDTPS